MDGLFFKIIFIMVMFMIYFMKAFHTLPVSSRCQRQSAIKAIAIKKLKWLNQRQEEPIQKKKMSCYLFRGSSAGIILVNLLDGQRMIMCTCEETVLRKWAKVFQKMTWTSPLKSLSVYKSTDALPSSAASQTCWSSLENSAKILVQNHCTYIL